MCIISFPFTNGNNGNLTHSMLSRLLIVIVIVIIIRLVIVIASSKLCK